MNNGPFLVTHNWKRLNLDVWPRVPVITDTTTSFMYVNSVEEVRGFLHATGAGDVWGSI